MEPISVSLLGYAFLQLDPEGIQSVLAQVLPELTKDAAKKIILTGGRSIIEQARHGELTPNHDLQRAARRSYLNATYMAVEQYKLMLESRAKTSPSDASKRIAWAEKLCDYLREDALATLNNGYHCPDSLIDGKYEVLFEHTKDPVQSGAELQGQLVGEILEEIKEWQKKYWNDDNLNYTLIPSEFIGALNNGWVYEEVTPTLKEKLKEIGWKRRGSKAAMSRGMQKQFKEEVEDPERIYWFPLFSAFFSQELKTNHRAETVFSLNLLTDIKKELGELKLNAQGFDDTKLQKLFADQLTGSLEGWGKEFCERLDALHELVEKGKYEVLGQLAIMGSAQERDHKLLESIDQKVVQVLEVVKRVETAVTGVKRRLPMGLPPRATAEEFFGRKEQLKKLTERLQQGKNSGVVGPAGLGKTALAAEVVRAVVGETEESLKASRYPDGVVLLDLYQLKAEVEVVFSALAGAFLEPHEYQGVEAKERAMRACAKRRALIIFEGGGGGGWIGGAVQAGGVAGGAGG